MGFVLHIAIDYYLHSVEPQRRLSEVFYFVERARTHTPPRFFFFFLPFFFCVSAITVFESCGGEQFHPFLSLSLSLFHFLFRARTLVTHHSRVHPHQCICHVAVSSCRPRRNIFFFFKFATAKHPLPWFSEKVRAHLVGAPFSLPLARLYCFRKRATSLYNMRRHPHFVPFRVQRVHRAEHSRST